VRNESRIAQGEFLTPLQQLRRQKRLDHNLIRPHADGMMVSKEYSEGSNFFFGVRF